MRRLLYLSTLLVAAGSAEVLDRVAVAIDNAVITESEILRQIRVTAFLNAEEPDFSRENKRQTAERLVEQMLIRREIMTNRYVTEPDGVADDLYSQLRDRFASDQEWRDVLRRYRLSEADIRDALRWQATLLEFVQVRFRPGVQVPEEELREYYEIEVAHQPNAPSFEEAEASIEQIMTQQRVDAALDRWLGQSRTQTRIIFREEVFR